MGLVLLFNPLMWACINGSSDIFFPTARITHDEMFRAGCNIQAKVDSSIDCAKIDEKFLLRDFINSQLRAKNYCSCQQGPEECTTFCSKYLSLDECIGLCAGSCGLPYPRK